MGTQISSVLGQHSQLAASFWLIGQMLCSIPTATTTQCTTYQWVSRMPFPSTNALKDCVLPGPKHRKYLCCTDPPRSSVPRPQIIYKTRAILFFYRHQKYHSGIYFLLFTGIMDARIGALCRVQPPSSQWRGSIWASRAPLRVATWAIVWSIDIEENKKLCECTYRKI